MEQQRKTRLWLKLEELKSSWRRRGLRREAYDVMTEKYWRVKSRSASRRFKFLKFRYGLWSSSTEAYSSIGILLHSVASMLKASLLGVLILAILLTIEAVPIPYAYLEDLQSKSPTPFEPFLVIAVKVLVAVFEVIQSKPPDPIGSFPSIAVQVLAALLGFYLATVGIVLGTYQDVSDWVRQLVLGNRETRNYLKLIGMSIGAGLVILLLQGLDSNTVGYLTIGAYALLVAVSGWALGTLAIGAFNLFNPVLLGNEPLGRLYRAIDQLDSKGLLQDDAVLRAKALETDRDLLTLAELIRLTKKPRVG